MVGLLIALFIIIPIVELFLFVQVAGAIGFLPALALVLVISVSGAWLCKREGLGVLRRMQDQLQRGELPASELVNGVLILFAGALLLTPGFLTDIAGLILLVPPSRALVRVLLLRRFEKRIRAAFDLPGGAVFGSPFGGFGGGNGPDGFVTGRVYTGGATYGVYDVREADVDEPGSAPGELGRP